MERFAVGQWVASVSTGELHDGTRSVRVEPKVMDLLCLLARANGAVVTHDVLLRELWPRMVVTDDTIARTVSRLRKALGDSTRAPRYIGTVPKRGYRLLVAVRAVETVATPVVVATGDARESSASVAVPTSPAPPAARAPWRSRGQAWSSRIVRSLSGVVAQRGAVAALLAILISIASLAPREAESSAALARADDFYFQFSYVDNQAAIALYRRILQNRPDSAAANAGLASALAQDAIRWPGDGAPGAPTFRRLADALHAGSLSTPAARAKLAIAREYAERAVTLEPRASAAYRARGLVRTAQGELESGLGDHQRAAALDPDAWGALINVADVQQMLGRDDAALQSLDAAYDAMRRAYVREPARVRPWQASLGVLIGERRYARGDVAGAERAWRRVLEDAPYDATATDRLAKLLASAGRDAEARALCDGLRRGRIAADGCGAAART
jgi:transcriptional activator of cad operon